MVLYWYLLTVVLFLMNEINHDNVAQQWLQLYQFALAYKISKIQTNFRSNPVLVSESPDLYKFANIRSIYKLNECRSSQVDTPLEKPYFHSYSPYSLNYNARENIPVIKITSTFISSSFYCTHFQVQSNSKVFFSIIGLNV